LNSKSKRSARHCVTQLQPFLVVLVKLALAQVPLQATRGAMHQQFRRAHRSLPTTHGQTQEPPVAATTPRSNHSTLENI
jgi:hypothetical protein